MVQKRQRLYFVDNLRIFLCSLVILHHLTISFGGPGDWYYQDFAVRLDGLTGIIIPMLLAVNQAFFMGFFFMISSYFSPGSYDRKGSRRFFIDRLIRLGIPMLVYVLVVNPLAVYAIQVNIRNYRDDFLTFHRLQMRSISGMNLGPLWFIEVLLIFSILYLLWRLAAERLVSNTRTVESEHKAPGLLATVLFALGLGLVTFIVRIELPVGWVYEPLGLQFPFFAQYIALLVLGVIAYHRDWFRKLADATGRVWQWATIGLIILLPIVLVAGGAMDGDFEPFMGGMRWQAAVYAFWEQLICVGMIISLLVWFRNRFNYQGRFTKALSAATYAAFVIHPLVLVLLALAVRQFRPDPLVKLAIFAPVALALCFGIGYALKRMPLVSRVL